MVGYLHRAAQPRMLETYAWISPGDRWDPYEVDVTAGRVLEIPEVDGTLVFNAEQIRLAFVELPDIAVQCVYIVVMQNEVSGKSTRYFAGLD